MAAARSLTILRETSARLLLLAPRPSICIIVVPRQVCRFHGVRLYQHAQIGTFPL
jgi:hypothetical protein